MREILFRGKRTNNGAWEEGCYVMYSTSIEYPYSRTNGKHCIVTAPHNIDYEVDPETVCEYSQLPDKCGRKIFERDIVKDEDDRIGVVRFGECDSYHIGFYVEWVSDHTKHYRQELGYWAPECEVIGNIFDNPDLTNGGRNDD